jgi:hypothetical protein
VIAVDPPFTAKWEKNRKVMRNTVKNGNGGVCVIISGRVQDVVDRWVERLVASGEEGGKEDWDMFRVRESVGDERGAVEGLVEEKQADLDVQKIGGGIDNVNHAGVQFALWLYVQGLRNGCMREGGDESGEGFVSGGNGEGLKEIFIRDPRKETLVCGETGPGERHKSR